VVKMKVPLFDLTRQYKTLRSEITENIDNIFSSGKVIMGENVKNLEASVSRYIGSKYAVGVANGSDALVISVHSLGIKPGDYVITTPYTFFATASAITRNGGIPIFADVDPVYYNINLEKVEEILNTHPQKEKIKAIIPVHLFGKTINLEKLRQIKEKYNVKIVEDCAQSIGSVWKNEKSGTVGEFGTISFFPTKNLGGYGDGGMIITSDEELYKKASVLRVHGASKKYYHEEIGYNSRLDEIQASVLCTKLKHLDSYTEKRINIAKKYKELFLNEKLDEFIDFPDYYEDRSHVYHQYVITVKNEIRSGLENYLTENEIGTSVYYPKGLHQQKCFEYLGQNIPGKFSVTDFAAQHSLALPIFPELREDEQEYVVKTIKNYFRR